MQYERITDEDLTVTLNMPQYGDTTKFFRYAQRLWELENQIKKGEYVKLPCKVGDAVYTSFCGAYSWTVERIDIYKDKILIRLGNEGTDDYACVNVKDLGKDWFFTKEEAEAAYENRLKQLQNKS